MMTIMEAPAGPPAARLLVQLVELPVAQPELLLVGLLEALPADQLGVLPADQLLNSSCELPGKHISPLSSWKDLLGKGPNRQRT
jgi:hypothetical protein